MQSASMKVLKAIAKDRITKFGCQEPELVTDQKVLKFLKAKPKPKSPRVITYKTTRMDELMEGRQKSAKLFDLADVDLNRIEDKDDDASGAFLTQVHRSRTFLTENY